ncbi:MAG: DUF1697 domain-containing protein, partial [Polyangiaceae bacterium]|nr:DUF1697 domain-containing protein [Polyangiaceae bacterium]
MGRAPRVPANGAARYSLAVAERSQADETEHVALLRGINVGGKNKLPMKELVPLFEQAGCRAVRTYIQSG